VGRVRATALIAGCAALALASCGGQSWTQAGGTTNPGGTTAAVGGSPQAVLLRALDTTNDSHTAHLSMTIGVAGVSFNTSVQADGVVDLQHQAADLTMTTGSIKLEVRIVGGAVYENPGTGWVTAPLPTTGLGAANNPDPTDYLAYLRGVADNVQTAGNDTVRGTPTTKYSGSVDLQHAIDRASAGTTKQSMQRLVTLVGDLSMPFTAWIDNDGRLRKLTMTMDLSTMAAKLGAPTGTRPVITISLEMYDFGTPVNVQPPTGAAAAPALQTRAGDRAAQSDLRNALTAEKTTYTDKQQYSASANDMKQIEPALGWGGKLHVHVGSAVTPGDGQTVCLGEKSVSGTNFVIADVAAGPYAGTYYGAGKYCPSGAKPQALAKLGTSW